MELYHHQGNNTSLRSSSPCFVEKKCVAQTNKTSIHRRLVQTSTVFILGIQIKDQYQVSKLSILIERLPSLVVKFKSFLAAGGTWDVFLNNLGAIFKTFAKKLKFSCFHFLESELSSAKIYSWSSRCALLGTFYFTGNQMDLCSVTKNSALIFPELNLFWVSFGQKRQERLKLGSTLHNLASLIVQVYRLYLDENSCL